MGIPKRKAAYYAGCPKSRPDESSISASPIFSKSVLAVEGADTSLANDEDLPRVLQEEIGRLFGKFRAAVVLCCLEGLTAKWRPADWAAPSGRSAAGCRPAAVRRWIGSRPGSEEKARRQRRKLVFVN